MISLSLKDITSVRSYINWAAHSTSKRVIESKFRWGPQLHLQKNKDQIRFGLGVCSLLPYPTRLGLLAMELLYFHYFFMGQFDLILSIEYICLQPYYYDVLFCLLKCSWINDFFIFEIIYFFNFCSFPKTRILHLMYLLIWFADH